MSFIVGDGVLDKKFLELTNYSVWMKFLKRKARIEAEFSQNALDWTKDVQKYMDSLSIETGTVLDKMKKMVGYHVSHFREEAEYFAKSAKIDQEAGDNMKRIISTDKMLPTDLLECREALNNTIHDYLRCKADIEKQDKKVDTALDCLYSLAIELKNKEPNTRQKRSAKKSHFAIQKHRVLIRREEEMRENLISLSNLYEDKVLLLACSKLDTFVTAWKKFYLQYVSCASFLSKRTDDHYLTAYKEIDEINTKKVARELLALSREIIRQP
ncbi:hypothetical protein ACJMK2_029501 [Sinanodonta woodiana]|uniref:BAR domain-containing protein n=1 Tax=Sinanodonta woodiana TaxID=1069815 RepID=A0ABD3XCB1_SINWO